MHRSAAVSWAALSTALTCGQTLHDTVPMAVSSCPCEKQHVARAACSQSSTRRPSSLWTATLRTCRQERHRAVVASPAGPHTAHLDSVSNQAKPLPSTLRPLHAVYPHRCRRVTTLSSQVMAALRSRSTAAAS